MIFVDWISQESGTELHMENLRCLFIYLFSCFCILYWFWYRICRSMLKVYVFWSFIDNKSLCFFPVLYLKLKLYNEINGFLELYPPPWYWNYSIMFLVFCCSMLCKSWKGLVWLFLLLLENLISWDLGTCKKVMHRLKYHFSIFYVYFTANWLWRFYCCWL